eukprot:scaffold134092_cov23-Prasinocladus_malaysianus.AAC.2
MANLGYHPTTPIDLSLPTSTTPPALLHTTLNDLHSLIEKNIEFAKLKQSHYSNKNRGEPPILQPGQLVRINCEHLQLKIQNCKKLKDRFIGPFTVKRKVSSVSYEISLPRTMNRLHNVFHIDRLESYNEDPDHPPPPRPEIPDVSDDTTDTYEVEDIIDVDFNRNYSGLLFRIRWAHPHNNPENDTWEPLRHLQDCDEVLQQFLHEDLWQNFIKQPKFKAFKAKHPKQIPKLN